MKAEGQIQPPKLKLFPRDPIGVDAAALLQVQNPLTGKGGPRMGLVLVCMVRAAAHLFAQTKYQLIGRFAACKPPTTQSQSGEGEQSKPPLSMV